MTSNSDITVICAQCGTKVRAPRQMLGSVGRCPTCRGKVPIVAADASVVDLEPVVDAGGPRFPAARKEPAMAARGGSAPRKHGWASISPEQQLAAIGAAVGVGLLVVVLVVRIQSGRTVAANDLPQADSSPTPEAYESSESSAEGARQGASATLQTVSTHQPSEPIAKPRSLRLGRMVPVRFSPGEHVAFPVTVERQGCVGTVRIRLRGLPPGVRSSSLVLASFENGGELEIASATGTEPGSTNATLVAVLDELEATTEVRLIIDAGAAVLPEEEEADNVADRPRASPLLLATDDGQTAVYTEGECRPLTSGGRPVFAHSVLMDSSGACWLGSQGRVLRLKGSEQTVFAAEDGLPTEIIGRLFEDSRRRIWAASYGGGIAFFQSGGWTKLTVADGLCFNDVNGFAEDTRGRIWVATDRGVSVVDGERFVDHPLLARLAARNVKSIAADKTGRVFLSFIGGVCIVQDDQILKVLTVAEGLPQRTAQATFVDSRGRVWFGTWGGGAVRLDNETATISSHESAPRTGLVGNICEDVTGDLLLSSLTNGLWQLKRDASCWEQIPTPPTFTQHLRIVAIVPRDQPWQPRLSP